MMQPPADPRRHAHHRRHLDGFERLAGCTCRRILKRCSWIALGAVVPHLLRFIADLPTAVVSQFASNLLAK